MDFNEFHNLPRIKAKDDLDRKEGIKPIVDVVNERIPSEPSESFKDPALEEQIKAAAEAEMNKDSASLEVATMDTSAISPSKETNQEKNTTDNSFIQKVATPTIKPNIKTATDGKEVKNNDDKGQEI